MSQNFKHELGQFLGEILGCKKMSIELHPRTLMAATGISMMKPETQFFYDVVKTAVERRWDLNGSW